MACATSRYAWVRSRSTRMTVSTSAASSAPGTAVWTRTPAQQSPPATSVNVSSHCTLAPSGRRTVTSDRPGRSTSPRTVAYSQPSAASADQPVSRSNASLT